MAVDGYVWFEDARVISTKDMRLLCMVGAHVVPLPVVMLHPHCTLLRAGDRGPLGVPQWWAQNHGLLRAARPRPRFVVPWAPEN